MICNSAVVNCGQWDLHMIGDDQCVEDPNGILRGQLPGSGKLCSMLLFHG